MGRRTRHSGRGGIPRPPDRRASAIPSSRGAAILASIAIAGAALWAYSTSLTAPFVFDDVPGIVENGSIRSWSTILDPPATSTLSGRPVANFTFGINYALGHDVTGYHALNIAFHIAAALLLFGVVRRTLGTPPLESRFAAHATPLAFAAALLWSVHPLNTTAVTYLVQRVESLMGLFYLLTLYGAIRGGRWRVAAVLACALGMGTKEVMVTAPVAVWLWQVVFAGAPWNPLQDRQRRGLYAGLAATWAILAILMLAETQARTVLTNAWSAGSGSDPWTPATYLWTQASVVATYLRLAWLPVPLAFDYYGWPPAHSPLEAAPQLLLVVALLGLTIAALVRRRPAGFAGAWFFLILAPTSSVVPITTEIAAEHRMYLPLIAPVVMTVLAAFALLQRAVRQSRPGLQRRAMTGLALIAAMAALGAALTTRARGLDFGSEESLWRDTVDKRPDNARARINYGITLMRAGRYAEAEAQMRAALPLEADDETRAQVHLQLGSALCAQGRCGEGVVEMEKTLALDPDVRDADAVLGQAYSETGDLPRAVHFLRRAVDRQPQNAVLLSRLAWLLATAPPPAARDGAAAIGFAERAVALTGRRDVPALEALAAAYAEQRRFSEAIATGEEAALLARAGGDAASEATLRAQVAVYRRFAGR